MDNFTSRVHSGFGMGSMVKDERGLSTVEYVILLVVVAAAGVGLWRNFGSALHDKLTAANTAFDQVTAEPSSGAASTPVTSTPILNNTPAGVAAAPAGAPVTKTKEDR